MSDIDTELTDLVADSEHIADDLNDMLKEANIELTEKQFESFIEFVQAYIQNSVETVLEFPEWFDKE
jgi:hypothetical protein